MNDKYSNVIFLILFLGFSIFYMSHSLDITGMVTGLHYEYNFTDAVCWGNATFDCADCADNCTDYGCSYIASSCSGEPVGSCGDYDMDRPCGHAGCTWNEDHCEGELLCSHFTDGDGCTSVDGCSWQAEDCSGISNCSEIINLSFCGFALGCEWTEATCNNSLDDDGDGYIDCADSDCAGYLYIGNYCENPIELNCADGFDNDGDLDTDCNDTDCNGDVNCISEVPDSEGFGGSTTNFSEISDLENVSNLTLEVINLGLIEWNDDGLNVSYVNFSRDIILGVNSIFVNSSNINANLNSSANLTLFNVTGFSETPIILMDGEYCDNCILNNYDGENISFTVQHFTNYSLGVNTELLIYDSYETGYGYIDEEIIFFANYTNRTNDEHISGAVCNISFEDGSSALMSDAGTNYNYTLLDGFDSPGYKTWNVHCNASGFENLSSTDDIFIALEFSEPNCSNTNFGDWNKTFGGAGMEGVKDILLTNDCGLLVGGFTYSYSSGSGDRDMWILKLNSTGELQWNKTFGDLEDTENINSIIRTSDGGFLVGGYTETCVLMGGSGSIFYTVCSDENMWILKLNSTGDLQWNQTFGGEEIDMVNSLVSTIDNGFMVVGSTQSYGAGSLDAWVLKLNSTGDLQWNKTFGGTDLDWAEDIIRDGADGFMVVGSTRTYGSGSDDVWALKLNSTGDLQWNKTFGRNGYDQAYSVIQENGDYLIGGLTNSYGAGNYDAWVLKLNSTGDLLWHNYFGGTSADEVQEIILNSQGYTVIGSTDSYGEGNGDVWVLKLNSTGDLQWNETFGGPDDDKAYSGLQVKEEEFIFTSYTESYGAGSRDIWVVFSNWTEIVHLNGLDESSSTNTNRGSSSRRCIEEWTCSDWGDCVGEGIRYRECVELNGCDGWNEKPEESEECELKFKLIDVQWDQLLDGQDFNVGEMMRLRVLFPENQYHIVDVYEIKENTVIMNIASRLQRTEYSDGIVKQFDVNEDNILDFEIWVREIYDEHVTVNVKYISLTEEESILLTEEKDYEVYARYKKEENNWVGFAFGNFLGFNISTIIFYLLILIGIIYYGWSKWKHH